jgi:hypothetical protein
VREDPEEEDSSRDVEMSSSVETHCTVTIAPIRRNIHAESRVHHVPLDNTLPESVLRLAPDVVFDPEALLAAAIFPEISE